MKLKGYIFVGPNHDKSKIKEDMTEDEYKKLWDTLTNLKDTFLYSWISCFEGG